MPEFSRRHFTQILAGLLLQPAMNRVPAGALRQTRARRGMFARDADIFRGLGRDLLARGGKHSAQGAAILFKVSEGGISVHDAVRQFDLLETLGRPGANESSSPSSCSLEEVEAMDALLKIAFGPEIHRKMNRLDGNQGVYYGLRTAVMEYGPDTVQLSLAIQEARRDQQRVIDHVYEAVLPISDPETATHDYLFITRKPDGPPSISLAGRGSLNPAAADIIEAGHIVRLCDVTPHLETLWRAHAHAVPAPIRESLPQQEKLSEHQP